MAPISTQIQSTPESFPQQRSLAGLPSEWPADAQSAYRDVLGELDLWSRKNDASKGLNSWIAEEAVRRSW